MTSEHELNAWRELGEEMGRVVSLMPKELFEDWFPDWFGPRLFDLQLVATQVSPPTPEPIIYVMLNGHGGVIGATFDESYAQANTNYITAIQIGPLSSPPPEPGDKR